MRHGKKFNHLGRTAPHRKAMLSNMASSLILHKRINTTVAKAKALRKYVEPLITKAKTDTTHSRRIAFSYLQDKFSVQELFGPIAEKVTERPGGYTRIIKTGIRLGDNAEMCMMELVDFNELLLQDSEAGKAKTRRSRRGGAKKTDKAAETAAPVAEAEVVTEEPAAAAEEAVVVEEEVVEATETVTEEPTAEASTDEPAEEAKEDEAEDTKKGE
ncbi:MAG: 50S ribosomal protein L17 [Cyclobacteriaceae bacterium]